MSPSPKEVGYPGPQGIEGIFSRNEVLRMLKELEQIVTRELNRLNRGIFLDDNVLNDPTYEWGMRLGGLIVDRRDDEVFVHPVIVGGDGLFVLGGRNFDKLYPFREAEDDMGGVQGVMVRWWDDGEEETYLVGGSLSGMGVDMCIARGSKLLLSGAVLFSVEEMKLPLEERLDLPTRLYPSLLRGLQKASGII